jgi:NitT/TauT family transport system permease protein
MRTDSVAGRRRTGLWRLLAVLALLVAWEIAGRSGWFSPLVLQPASTVLAFLAGQLASGAIWPHLWLTLYELLVGFAIAAALGLGVGLFVGTKRLWRLAVEPLLIAVFATPLVLLYDIFAIWFGIGAWSKITFGAMSGFFPVALNTIAGVAHVDPLLVRAARAMGLRPAGLYTKVIVPSALPSILAGLRSGASLTLIGVLVGEMLLSKAGIGFLLQWASDRLAATDVFAYVVVALLFSLVFNEAFRWIDGRASRWRQAS